MYPLSHPRSHFDGTGLLAPPLPPSTGPLTALQQQQLMMQMQQQQQQQMQGAATQSMLAAAMSAAAAAAAAGAVSKPCKVCGAESALECGLCTQQPPYLSTYYCCQQHQSLDWKAHSKHHEEMSRKFSAVGTAP